MTLFLTSPAATQNHRGTLRFCEGLPRDCKNEEEQDDNTDIGRQLCMHKDQLPCNRIRPTFQRLFRAWSMLIRFKQGISVNGVLWPGTRVTQRGQLAASPSDISSKVYNEVCLSERIYIASLLNFFLKILMFVRQLFDCFAYSTVQLHVLRLPKTGIQ